jgi:hypothetical protein
MKVGNLLTNCGTISFIQTALLYGIKLHCAHFISLGVSSRWLELLPEQEKKEEQMLHK